MKEYEKEKKKKKIVRGWVIYGQPLRLHPLDLFASFRKGIHECPTSTSPRPKSRTSLPYYCLLHHNKPFHILNRCSRSCYINNVNPRTTFKNHNHQLAGPKYMQNLILILIIFEHLITVNTRLQIWWKITKIVFYSFDNIFHAPFISHRHFF